MLQDQENAPALGNARADEDDPIRCTSCREPLAPRSARIDLSPHTFVNPDGLVFELLGVREAPGSTTVGKPTLYWTWFAGYAWQIALCRGCGAHVGWAYSGESRFWGLIRDRVE